MNKMEEFFAEQGFDLTYRPQAESHVANIEELFPDNFFLLSGVAPNEGYIENIKFYRLGGSRLLLSLKHPSSLHFVGFLSVKCLAGSADIDGFILKADPQRLHHAFSLSSHSASCISSADCKLDLSRLAVKELVSLEVYKDVLKDMNLTSQKPSSLLLLSMGEFPPLLKLHRELRYTLSSSRRTYKGNIIFSDYEEFVNCVFDVPCGNHITKKTIIHQAVDEFAHNLLQIEAPRLVICGGKGVGKSTTLRYISNKLLSKNEKILFIDFDIGQPEFTVPGCVSVHEISEPLLGPCYTHIMAPLKSIFLGFVSSDMCFTNYRNAVKELKTFCSHINCSGKVPWVINTMGYVKGCGLLLINDIISSFDVSHVLELRSSSEPKLNFVLPPTPQRVKDSVEDCPPLNYDLVTVSISTSLHNSSISAKMSRELMAFFYLVGSSSDLRTENIMIQSEYLREGTSFISLIPDYYILSRGEIVAICSAVPKDGLYDCLGFGVVVSFCQNTLVLKTPLPTEKLESCAIVRGDLSMRYKFFIDNLHLDNGMAQNSIRVVVTSGDTSFCPALFKYKNA